MTNEEKIKQGLCTAQTDALTGEVTLIPFTDEEIANIQEAPAPIDPLDKLKDFLAANPDVAEVLK